MRQEIANYDPHNHLYSATVGMLVKVETLGLLH